MARDDVRMPVARIFSGMKLPDQVDMYTVSAEEAWQAFLRNGFIYRPYVKVKVMDSVFDGNVMKANISVQVPQTAEMIVLNPFSIGEEDEDVNQAIQDIYRDASEEMFQQIESSIRDTRKKEGLCLECGSKGEWINMVLVCSEHGRIAG